MSDEKVRIVLDGKCGECSIAEFCRREGIAEKLYVPGSGKSPCRRKARAATSSEVTEPRRQSPEVKAVVAEQALELRLLKICMVRPDATTLQSK